jgi:hypothetical protein
MLGYYVIKLKLKVNILEIVLESTFIFENSNKYNLPVIFI